MSNTKHVGRLINTDRRVVVVFRQVPDEPQSCLVVDTDALPDWMHDGVINAVESPGAQSSSEFAEFASRQSFSDGTNMLNSLHLRGLLHKQPTSNVMMTPNTQIKIKLDELNDLINKQKGEEPVAEPVQDTVTETATEDSLLDNTALAQQMIAQADGFEAEAKRLRDEAYDLAPELAPKKKTTRKKTQAA